MVISQGGSGSTAEQPPPPFVSQLPPFTEQAPKPSQFFTTVEEDAALTVSHASFMSISLFVCVDALQHFLLSLTAPVVGGSSSLSRPSVSSAPSLYSLGEHASRRQLARGYSYAEDQQQQLVGLLDDLSAATTANIKAGAGAAAQGEVKKPTTPEKKK
jgi:hypothetical protein